jgi:hypothetical protein
MLESPQNRPSRVAPVFEVGKCGYVSGISREKWRAGLKPFMPKNLKIATKRRRHDLVNQGLKLAEVVSDPVHGTQIDEQIGQCVDVRDSVPVT